MGALVGRRDSVGALRRALDRAGTGAGGAMLLAGAVGVGKSRLASECAALARDEGFQVLKGAAVPHRLGPSLAPIVQAFRPLVEPDALARWPRLVDGLPRLGCLFDGLPVQVPEPLADSGLERLRLFEAVWGLLERVTRRRPVLLVLEDLHWADPATVAMTAHLIRGLCERPFLLVATCRRSDIDPQLRAVLASLRSAGLLTDLAVEALDRVAVAELATDTLDGDVPDGLTELLVERTRGVPLFVTGLLRVLVSSGRLVRSGGRWVLLPGPDPGPAGDVVEFVRDRLLAVASEDRQLLAALTVLADGWGAWAVGEVSGVPADDRLAALCRSGLVDEVASSVGVEYRTAHPLIAEAAYADLSPRARHHLHAAASVLVRRVRPDDGLLVAHHVRLAGDAVDPTRAIDVLMDAIRETRVRRLGEDGVEFAEAAIDRCRAAGREELAPGLLVDLADAATLAGMPGRAIEAWHAVAERSHGTPVARAGFLRRAAVIEWDQGQFVRARDDLALAGRLLDGAGDASERVAVAETTLWLASRSGGGTGVLAGIAELEELAAGDGSPRAAVLARLHRANLDYTGAIPGINRERHIGPLLDAVAELDEPLLLPWVHRPWMLAALFRGDHREARRRSEEAARHARALGDPVAEVPAVLVGAHAAFLGGDWDVSLETTDAVLAMAHRTGVLRSVAHALALRGVLLVHRGQYEAARACTDEVRTGFGDQDQHISAVVDATVASLCLAAGDPTGAVAAVAQARPASSDPILLHRVRAQAYLAAGNRAAAREAADALAVDPQEIPYAAIVGQWLRARITAQDDPERAAADLVAVVDRLDDLTIPYDGALARLERAELLREARPDAAAELAGRAFDELTRLGALPAADRARRLLRILGCHPPRARVQQRPGRLSARQIEVARLVARGLTNAEVARTLVVSTRTVTTHLDHIYRRLGIDNRTALTRYVLEHGMDT